jgi:hypothetical protein
VAAKARRCSSLPGDVYGMKQPKWITAVDLVDRFESGYGAQ